MQQALMQQRPFAAAVGRSRAARPARAAAGQVVAAVVDGARVRVTAPIKVYHVGKFKGGLELQGLEATVVQADVRNYKHHDGNQHELSANLPIKVQFMVPGPEGKDVKVLCHLSEEEIEVL